MSVRWIETTRAVYSTVYEYHNEELKVFGSYTYCEPGREEMLTEWGFKDADYPLLKSERHGDEWRFWIAGILEDEE
jgi:hypothetical protein